MCVLSDLEAGGWITGLDTQPAVPVPGIPKPLAKPRPQHIYT